MRCTGGSLYCNTRCKLLSTIVYAVNRMNYEFQAEKALFSLVAAQEGEAINEIFKTRSNEKSMIEIAFSAPRRNQNIQIPSQVKHDVTNRERRRVLQIYALATQNRPSELQRCAI